MERTGSKSRSIPFSKPAAAARALPACHKCPNYNIRGERTAINAKREHPGSRIEGFGPRFPYGWNGVLVYLTDNLNAIIYPLKKEILNE